MGKNCLLIEKGFVKLDGYDYGFIGGASMFLENHSTLIFTGDITKHPNYNILKDFCNSINIEIDWINEIQLTDIGGMIHL